MGRFKYLLTTIAIILLPLVAVSEQIQTNLIQIPIMAEKKAELEAMLFSPVGFAHTMKQKGFVGGDTGYATDDNGNVTFVIWGKWQTKEDYYNYLATAERSEGSKFSKTMRAVMTGPPSLLWVKTYQDMRAIYIKF